MKRALFILACCTAFGTGFANPVSARTKLSARSRGKKRVFSQQWKDNIRRAQIERAERCAKGVTLKPSGYKVFTRGPHKQRAVHVVAAEQRLGRRLHSNEVVHHIDGNRTNNDPSNLQVMTRAEHARLHALENLSKRERNQNGRFR